MEIHYCDLCNTVLNEGRNVVVIVDDKNFKPGIQQNYGQQDRVSYEVCNNCVLLLHKIFKYKKNQLKKIEDWISETYSLESKEGDVHEEI